MKILIIISLISLLLLCGCEGGTTLNAEEQAICIDYCIGNDMNFKSAAKYNNGYNCHCEKFIRTRNGGK